MHAKILFGAILGLIGGIIGAGIWAGVAYATGYEIGWIAWGVGFLVGIGAFIGSAKEGGMIGGLIAVVIAVACVTGGKYASSVLVVNKYMAEEFGMTQNPFEDYTVEDYICMLATQDAEQREADGESLDWPDGFDNESAWGPGEFPKNVWGDAVNRWNGMSGEQQQAYQNSLVSDLDSDMAAASEEVFLSSFGIMDVVFYGLAMVTAFKLGSGMED